MTNDKRLLIMRGVPGAGKSTALLRRAPSAVVASADHYFVRADGKYVFDASKLKHAHDACFRKFQIALEQQAPLVAVDNTNRNWSAMKRYVEEGLAAGYKVELIDLQTHYKVAAARNIHGVPEAAVLKMSCQQLDIPPDISANSNFKHTITYGEDR